MPKPKPAIVLLSGGIDSATVLAICRAEGYKSIALSFLYGQRHATEIDAARAVAAAGDAIEHRVIEIDLRAFGGSALTSDIAVPKNRDPARMSTEIPVTYVPARNTIFLSYALALAEVRAAHDIFIGVNAVDFSGYPDCRPEYIAQFEKLANVATKSAVSGKRIRIHAPLIDLSKEQIIERGLLLGVDFAQTRSCYDPDGCGRACAHCDSCHIRLAAFKKLGMTDPAPYVA